MRTARKIGAARPSPQHGAAERGGLDTTLLARCPPSTGRQSAVAWARRRSLAAPPQHGVVEFLYSCKFVGPNPSSCLLYLRIRAASIWLNSLPALCPSATGVFTLCSNTTSPTSWATLPSRRCCSCSSGDVGVACFYLRGSEQRRFGGLLSALSSKVRERATRVHARGSCVGSRAGARASSICVCRVCAAQRRRAHVMPPAARCTRPRRSSRAPKRARSRERAAVPPPTHSSRRRPPPPAVRARWP